MLSGPAALRVLIVENVLFMLAADRQILGGWWSLPWTCVVLCFTPGKEAVEVFEQRDVAVADLWHRGGPLTVVPASKLVWPLLLSVRVCVSVCVWGWVGV